MRLPRSVDRGDLDIAANVGLMSAIAGFDPERGVRFESYCELRVKGALPRMEALQEVIDKHGVTHMAAICAICKTQFAKVVPYYGFDMDMITSVHQLVGDALLLGTKE